MSLDDVRELLAQGAGVQRDPRVVVVVVVGRTDAGAGRKGGDRTGWAYMNTEQVLVYFFIFIFIFYINK